jgi:outer membrane protein OmpU
MKKILLATTILSMSAGFAAADVSVSGDARMGVVSNGDAAVFSNRIRVKFSGSGTTDGGLAFGGSFRANEASLAESAGTKGSTFISGAFGKISFGSLDSGDAASVGQLASVGWDGAGYGNSISYAADAGGDNGFPGALSDAGGARVLYTYSAGALTINASTTQLTDGGATAYGIGGSYASGALTLGVGYGSVTGGSITGLNAYDTTTGTAIAGVVGTTTVAAVAPIAAAGAGYYETSALDASITDISLSAAYVMDNTTIKAIYQIKTLEASADARAAAAGTAVTIVRGHDAISLSSTATSMGLSVVQKMDALSLTAYGINTTVEADANLSDDKPTVSRYGIGFGYDLGGGASVSAGWATVDALVPAAVAAGSGVAQDDLEAYTLTSVSADTWDLGLNFSF